MMQKRPETLFLPALMVLLFAGLNSCYYDIEEELYPSAFCDTTGVVSYSAIVVPILQANCISCHGGSSPTAGVGLDTYSKVIEQVEANLSCTINHAAGCSPMPDGAPKLRACDILKIDLWISNGAQND